MRRAALIGSGIVAGLLGLVLAAGAVWAAVNTNGGFETGDFTGWTVWDNALDEASTWYVYTGKLSPVTNTKIHKPPPEGLRRDHRPARPRRPHPLSGC